MANKKLQMSMENFGLDSMLLLAHIFMNLKLQSRPTVVGTLELYHVSPFSLINVGKYRVFSKKREKTTGLSTLKVWGGENLLLVPTLLSGFV